MAAENTRAIALYETEGFVEYGEAPGASFPGTRGFREVVYMRLELLTDIFQFFR